MAILLCAGAEDAMAPRPISSRLRFCLPVRHLVINGPSSPSSLRTSIARATPRPRRPSTVMSERVRTTPPALTVLVVIPVLWNGSTLGAVRSAGESTERRPMFAPGRMSLGRRLPCSGRVTLEKVEDEAVGRMRLSGKLGRIDTGSVTVTAISLLELATRAWRMRSSGHESHSSSQSPLSPPSSSISKLNGSWAVLESSVVRSENFLRSSWLVTFGTGGSRGGPPHKTQAIASLTLPKPDCWAR